MGLWKLLGGEINHKAIERSQQRQQDLINLEIRNVCTSIITNGIIKALDYNDENKIKFVLKKFPDCPQIPNKWGHITWGKYEWHIENWKEAQQWLKDKEQPKLPENNSKNKRNIDDLIKWIKDLQEENHVLREKLKKIENKK